MIYIGCLGSLPCKNISLHTHFDWHSTGLALCSGVDYGIQIHGPGPGVFSGQNGQPTQSLLSHVAPPGMILNIFSLETECLELVTFYWQSRKKEHRCNYFPKCSSD